MRTIHIALALGTVGLAVSAHAAVPTPHTPTTYLWDPERLKEVRDLYQVKWCDDRIVWEFSRGPYFETTPYTVLATQLLR